MVDIWREKVPVRFGDVDRSDRLTLGSVFSLFQEAAISHAADLGIGRDALGSTGLAWILSRLSLFVKRRPSYGETVSVSTWPRKWEKLFALRDYEIRGAGDEVFARGRGAWLVLDIEKRRVLRPQAFMEPMPPNEGIDAFPAGAAMLGQRSDLVKAAERTALYSDIDFYGHANNARYIQWLQDVTDAGILTKADEARLDVNYISEVLPGDTIELWTAPLKEDSGDDEKKAGYNPADYPAVYGPGFAYEGRRSDGTESSPDSRGQTVFRAELRTGGSR